ncbi:hypothetical protein CA11_53090 [Gimesia maris]|uniref:hypothetical protein n=1 Tax=Gimesia maris TaxID=122 RepID=UPI00118C1DEE|nr:hypothetical protein [Gimesia maris]QDU17467.1 hypothetical protein CA11_53090 [Gimesia maris]
MPTPELMTWKPTEKRWVKRIPVGYPEAGKFVRAGKRTLQKLYSDLYVNNTKTGSRAAANQFWQDFIDQQNMNAVMYDSAIKKRQIILEAERIRREEFQNKHEFVLDILPSMHHPDDRLQMLPDEKQTLKKQIALLEHQKSNGLPYGETETELPDLPTIPILLPEQSESIRQESKQTLSILIAEKLERLEKRTQLKPTNKKYLSVGGLKNQKRFLNSIITSLGDLHIDLINEKEVIKYHDFINEMNLVESSKLDYWVYFKEFIQGCCDDGIKKIIPLNLHKKSFNFSPDQKTPKPATIEEAKYVLSICKEKGKSLSELAVLLHLNCGMYNKDIALLKKCDVDLQNKTLTYKRSKALKHEQIERVTYPLWKRTVELLKELESNGDNYWLLNSNGKNHMIGEDGKRKNGIGKEFSKFKKAHLPQYKKDLKDFRKTGCTELENQKQPDTISRQFLQQSAEDTKGKWYSGQMRTAFTEAILGLEKVFEIKEAKK